MSFIDELKRRNVIRVAFVYAVAAWLLIQIVATTFPILHLPDWSVTLVTVLILIGFPLAIILAWAFELTPEGLKKDKDVDRNRSMTPVTGRKLDFAIITLLVVTLGYFAYDKFVASPVELQDSIKSIAVMPFVNMSDDSEQEYFSDGLSEELLNLLAQIPELRVTSRTSSFSFKGKDITVPEVGRALHVDHVLEGSVRRSGDTIRITAQLIEASTDMHIWSETWDRNFEDVFVIQDEIAEYVVDALKLQLLGEIPRVFETTRDAYELYLQANFLMEQGDPSRIPQAEAINQRVLEIDPNYVPAWNQRALIFQQGPNWNTWPMAESAPRAREAAMMSLQLFENNAEAHAILGQIAYDFDYDYELAGREINTALEMDTDNVIALQIAAEMEYRQGNFDKSIEYLDKANAIDPINGRHATAALVYFYAGRHAEGISIWEESIKIWPNTPYLRKALALNLLEMGDVDGAIATIEKEPTEGHRLHALALIYQTMGDSERSKDALEKLIANSPRWTFEVTEVYSFRGELDEAFEWINRAIERRDRGLRHVMASPYLDKMKKDPRFDDVLVQLGLMPGP